MDADIESKLSWLGAFPFFEAATGLDFPDARRGWSGDRIIGAVAKSANRVLSTHESVAAILALALSLCSPCVDGTIPLASGSRADGKG